MSAFIAIFALPGCAQYLDRKDTVVFSAGNAVQTNQLAHIIDPWPRHARDPRILSNGQRMQGAIERYRTNRVTDPRSSGGSHATGSSAEGASRAAAPSETQ